MELGPLVADFKPPQHPKGISLDGKLVQLVPMEAEEHAEALFLKPTNWIQKEQTGPTCPMGLLPI